MVYLAMVQLSTSSVVLASGWDSKRECLRLPGEWVVTCVERVLVLSWIVATYGSHSKHSLHHYVFRLQPLLYNR